VKAEIVRYESVSTDLVPEGVDQALWSRDEAEHLRR